jgi:predicted aminopeptidase
MRTKASLLALLLLAVPATSGCYLAHVASGQWRLLRARQPIEEVLTASDTSPELRDSLELVGHTRRFAAELGLEVGGNYTSFVPWPGDRVVTAVVAARAGEVEPAGFWFPIVGRVPYKGYFDPEKARAQADELRAEGMDVCLVPVRAYSTLGWFDDPVTEPMLRGGAGQFVETILHELVHATVYVTDDADFNEGVATFIGEEASVRFYAEDADAGAAAALRRREVEDGRRLDAAILGLRERIEALYAEAEPGPDRTAKRARLEDEARRAIAVLPLETRDARALSAQLRLNDACLALAATYTADLGRYSQTLEALDGDLPAFVSRVRAAAADADDPASALVGP